MRTAETNGEREGAGGMGKANEGVKRGRGMNTLSLNQDSDVASRR